MRKRELPLWFKIETLVFAFFSIAVLISYFRMEEGAVSEGLLAKVTILVSGVVLIWLVSLLVCCFKE